MRSEATTVAGYLRELPADRRKALSAVRRVIREHLPEGYEEGMNFGMIVYQVPLRRYPETYNGQPLMYAALASQKHYMAVYLTGIYADERARRAFEKAYRTTGKRLDAGKSCVRFKTLDDLPLPLIGQTVASVSVDELIAVTERAHARPRSKTARGKPAAAKKTTVRSGTGQGRRG